MVANRHPTAAHPSLQLDCVVTIIHILYRLPEVDFTVARLGVGVMTLDERSGAVRS